VGKQAALQTFTLQTTKENIMKTFEVEITTGKAKGVTRTVMAPSPLTAVEKALYGIPARYRPLAKVTEVKHQIGDTYRE